MTAKLRSSIKAGLNSGLRKSISGGVSATGLTYNITISGNTFALRSTGTVDYSVNWGDGSNETSTSNTLSHTFADGSYSVVVVTTLGKFRPYINNSGDGDRITSVVIGARINLSNSLFRAWRGAAFMTSFECPFHVTSHVSNFQEAWRGCISLTSFPSLDVSSGINLAAAWRSCSSLTSFPLLDVSSGIRFDSAWHSCTNLANFPANMFDTTGTLVSNAFGNTWAACALTAQSIENILVSLDTNGASNITLNISGGTNAAKTTWSTAANTAYDNLITKGWTISFNA